MFAKTEEEMKELKFAIESLNTIGMSYGSLRTLNMLIMVKLGELEGQESTNPVQKIAATLLQSLQEAGVMPTLVLSEEHEEEEESPAKDEGDGCGDPACKSCELDSLLEDQEVQVVYRTDDPNIFHVPSEVMDVIRANVGVPSHVPDSGISGGIGTDEDNIECKFRFNTDMGVTFMILEKGQLSDMKIANFEAKTKMT